MLNTRIEELTEDGISLDTIRIISYESYSTCELN